ncbi:P-loop containing nucleoside triphosphate hydrolase protein [Pisolithus thermaeus]|nr:P-loop containing nucleoside triphosphate hydrolase protein [Pisolithus thermaeus]
MGKTGSGMSNLINKLTGMQPEDGAGQLFSCTKTVCAYKCNRNGQRFIFVDTPGFDNGELSQCAVLTAIATWLKEMYRKSIELTGVIYTHNLGGGSMGAVDEQSFQLLCRMCGNEAADRVRLVTTMWDEVDESEAVEMEETLKGTQWQSFIQAGAQPRRFVNTPKSAWDIVESLGTTTKTLLLQKEMVDMGKALEGTTAGRRLRQDKPVTLW